jgi:hypothetical protein
MKVKFVLIIGVPIVIATFVIIYSRVSLEGKIGGASVKIEGSNESKDAPKKSDQMKAASQLSDPQLHPKQGSNQTARTTGNDSPSINANDSSSDITINYGKK